MCEKKKILALFDFCETLVAFQSASRYLELVAEHRGYINQSRMQKLKTKIQRKIKKRLNKIVPKKWRKQKEQVAFEILRGFEVEKAIYIAREFLHNELLVHINTPILARLQWHKEQGHTIAIVSGGFEIYIKLFAEHFSIPHVVAVGLETQNGFLTGNMEGIHTMEHRKLYKLSQMLDITKYDLAKSYAYSDCPSDIALLSLVGNPKVVACGKDTKWAEILGFEIIEC